MYLLSLYIRYYISIQMIEIQSLLGTTLSSETRKNLEDIGEEIVRKCQGLPLAVKAMGGLLRNHVDVSKWQ
jgi:hypothetical protein